MTEERGVSNTLGFVILFGVVFGSIVAVNTLGLGALQEGRDATIAQNAGLSMESMSDAIEDLRVENTTARLSVVRGGGGSLTSGEETTIRVTTVDPTGSPTTYSETFRPIVYQLDESSIVYESGAVIRTQESGGAVLIDGPQIAVNDQKAIIPIIATNSANGNSVSGKTVTTYLEKSRSELLFHGSSYDRDVILEIETTSQRAPVWEQTLEERFGGADDCSITGGGDVVECTSSVGSSRPVMVRTIGITYEFAT